MAQATDLDLAEQIARVFRSNEETQQFVAEQRKVMAEQLRLQAAAAKLNRSRPIAPWQFAAGGAAAGVVLVGAGIALAKLFHP